MIEIVSPENDLSNEGLIVGIPFYWTAQSPTRRSINTDPWAAAPRVDDEAWMSDPEVALNG